MALDSTLVNGQVADFAKGPIFDGYCSNTVPDLAAAVTSGLRWSTFSDSDYRNDARKVSDLLRKLSSAATVIGKAQAIQIAADGLDRGGELSVSR